MPPAPPFANQDPSQLSIDQLAELLTFCDDAYYRDAQSPLSDAAYDRAKDRLRAVAPDHPVVHKIGAPAGSGDKVAHVSSMLSLDKCTMADEFWAWYRGNLAQSTGKPNSAKLDDAARQWAAQPAGRLVATPKIDGLACALRYNAKGELEVAATRGDGRVGEDVTLNAKRIANLVQRLPAGGPQGPLEVRGEVYLPLSRFASVSDQFANPRNLAAGVLKAKDSSAFPPENLAFFAYDLISQAGDVAPTTESAKLELLVALGFAPPPWRVCSGLDAQAAFDRFAANRATDDFESDGIVLRMDDLALAARLGVTSHHPRAAIAWKYAANSDTTVLEAVHWSVARTGTITPVAVVAPVTLSGATVTRATLHNVSNLLRLALRPGDQIEVVRRGGVIPHVERVVLPGTAAAVQPPSACPSCGAPTVQVQRDDGKGKSVLVLQCGDPDHCVAARQRSLLHFCQSLELEGFGDKVVEILIDQGLVDNPADLFLLRVDDLTALPRVGPTMASNLLAQVQRARRTKLPMLLVSLGIPSLGKQTAQLLAARGDLAAIRSMSTADIAQLHSLGDKSAEAIVRGLAEQSMLLDALLLHIEVETQMLPGGPGDGPMAGQVVVFTGAMQRMGRRDAQQWVIKQGGLAGDSVTADTTFLVVGGDELDSPTPSSKLKKAIKLRDGGQKLQILSEDGFFQNFGSVL